MKNILIYAGFAFLISLMVFIMLNDIAKTLPKGWKSMLPFLRWQRLTAAEFLLQLAVDDLRHHGAHFPAQHDRSP